jgi:Ca2+-binding EF-hand superfamily protein
VHGEWVIGCGKIQVRRTKLFQRYGVSSGVRTIGARVKKRELLMKTIPVSFLVAGMLLPGICLAQPPPPPVAPPRDGMDPRRQPQRPFADAWEKADADHDGFISVMEFAAMQRIQNLPEEQRDIIFKRLDKNGDRMLGRDELMKFGHPRDAQPTKRLWELDADKSGGISFDEFKEGQLFKKLPPDKLTEVFGRLDTDGDGLITPRDRPEQPFKRAQGKPRPKGRDDKRPDDDNEPGRLEKMIGKLDSNSDGGLSFEEYRTGAGVKDLSEDEQEDRFEKLDKNGDHKLSKEDLLPPREPRTPIDR